MVQFAYPVTGIDSGWPIGSDGWAASVWSNMAIIQMMTRRRVINQTTNAPPGSPASGDCYIIGPSPTGAWAGKAKQLAIYGESSWYYVIPENGFPEFRDNALGRWFRYDGTNWVDAWHDENNWGLRGVAVVNNPGSGTYTLSRQEAACAIIAVVGPGALTVDWPTSLDGVSPQQQVVYNLFNGDDITLHSQTVAGSTDIRLPRSDGVEILFNSPANTFFAGFLLTGFSKAVHRALPGGGYRGLADGGEETIVSSDLGQLLWCYGDTDTSVRTIKIPTFSTKFGNAMFYVYCDRVSGVNIVGDVGVTMYGGSSSWLQYGDWAVCVRDATADSWFIYVSTSRPSTHRGVESETGTTYTFNRSDRGVVKRFTNAADVAVTVPANGTENMGENTIVYVVSDGAGGLHLVPDTGVTLVGRTDLVKGEEAVLRRVGTTNTWMVSTSIGAAAHPGILTETGTTHTLGRANKGRVTRYTNSGAVAVTVPDSSNVEMGENCVCYIRCESPDGLHLVPDTGVTLNGQRELTLDEEAILRRDGTTDTWYITNIHGDATHGGDKTVSGATHTLARSDKGKFINFTNSAEVAVTIPDSSNVEMGEDCICFIRASGAGGIVLVADTGVTINGPLDLTTTEEAVLRRSGTTDTWYVTILRNAATHAGVVDVTGTTHTLVRANKGRLVNCTNAAAVTVTVPALANTEMGENCICYVRAEGAGGVTLSPDTGVTLKGPTSLATDDVATLRRVGSTDTWIINKG